MFSEYPNARAYEFVLEQLRQWGYQDDLDLFEQAYQPFAPESKSTWKNIIVLIPGKDPDLAYEQILLTAHLDSISMGRPEERSPRADDNGSGIATLLEAARIFRGLEFKYTIKIFSPPEMNWAYSGAGLMSAAMLMSWMISWAFSTSICLAMMALLTAVLKSMWVGCQSPIWSGGGMSG
jgi:leucyl aminopeptidase